jgi:hypothetical protein
MNVNGIGSGQALPQEDRKNIAQEVSQLDLSNLSTDDLMSSIETITNSYYGISDSMFSTPVYA